MIGERSIHDNLESSVSLNAVVSAAAGPVDGATIDTADADAKMFTIFTGAYTDGTHTVTFWHRKKSTDVWTQIAAQDLDGYDQTGTNQLATDGTFSVAAGAKANKVYQVGYIGGWRYLKATRGAAGATTGAVLGVLVQVARQRYLGQNPMRRKWEA
jgi:hypothetical protein